MVRVKEVTQIPIALIELGVAPPITRPADADAGLEELMASIKKYGLLQPIVVCERPQGKYEVLAGRRRLLAYVKLRAPHIAAVVMDEGVDADTAAAIWLTENLVRETIPQKDLGMLVTALVKKYGSVALAAERTGIAASKLAKYAGPPGP